MNSTNPRPGLAGQAIMIAVGRMITMACGSGDLSRDVKATQPAIQRMATDANSSASLPIWRGNQVEREGLARVARRSLP